jgi:amino acid adenylation domain-containing protein
LEALFKSLAAALPPSPPAGALEEVQVSVEVDQASDCPKIDRCIHDLVEEQVIVRPQQEAVCAHDGSLSFADLSALSSKLGHQLNSLGACAEQRVAILMPKSRWYSVSVLATLKAGAAFVPLDPSHPDNRLRQLIEDIEPCALVTVSSLSARAHALECSNVLTIDDMDFDTQPEEQLTAPVTPSNAAYMIFTSGSTGKPKGVVVEHSALATSAMMRGTVLGLGPDSRVLQYAPHTFDVSVDEILTTWIHGGCVCVPSENDRFMIAEFMEAKRVTAALLTPTSARTLNPDDVPSLRTLQTGGEVLTEDVNDKWSNRVTLFNVYGPTEASVACVISNRTGLRGTGHVLGQAVGGKCWVVDPDNLSKRLAPGEIGELLIAGPILARGYFRDPARTEASFVRLATGERVYKTGDLASMDATGTISYHGRKDLEVKIRGQRINVAEVEHAIIQCDSVHSAAVEYPRSGPCAERLVAIICAESSDSEAKQPVDLFAQAKALDYESLKPLLDHVSGVLTPAMVPSKWITLPYLPQTTSGKVDRKQVRAWLEDIGTDTYNRIFHSTLDRTPERVLADDSDSLVAVWSKVLKLEPRHLHLNQSFIRNGGDSIMAMEARTLAHSAGIVVNIHDLLSTQSLHEIGLKAASSTQSVGPSTFEEDTDEPFALSPVQQMYFEKIQDPSLGLQQRVSVEFTQPIHPDHLRIALDYLVHQHRILAVRFALKEGTWVQYIPSDKTTEVSLYGFYTTPPEPLDDFCTAPMSIEQGPLFHAHLGTSDNGPQNLILCAHHLVVDFVSWRVILHDLHDALLAAQIKTALQPVTKPTLTFRQWCREQVKYASSLLPDAVLPYQPGPLGLDFWQPSDTPSLANTYAGVVQQEFRLSSNQTAQLLNKFNNMPSLHPTDAMIGAFAMAFRRIFPERETPSIFIENHGREPWNASLDVSRTVGWFTAAYPVHLPKSTLHKLEEAIRTVAERRQATPANGHAYWACRWLSARGKEAFAHDSRHQQMEVVFNYAGNVVQRAPDHGLFGSTVRTAEIGHPDCPRFSLFDIVATIEQPNQELVVSYSFPGHLAHQSRIHELLHGHQQLLALAVNENHAMVPLSQLHSCPADISRRLEEQGMDMNQDVEMIYPASPIQQHMLQRQALEPWYYRVRGTWVLEKAAKSSSAVDTERLMLAWREVVSYHSTLRTVYTYSNDLHKFIAVVLRNVNPSVARLQASDKTTSQSLCKDTESLTPPHRMVLLEMSDGAVECQFEFSHAIIDAASRSIVLQHLADAYEGTIHQRSFEAPSYWEYLNHVQSEASDSSVTTKSLAPSGAVAALPFELPQPGTSILETCMANEITVSSFFMTAWAIVLSRQLGNQFVSFDYVLSDRSVDIAGIESAVGLFIRLPACKIAIAPDTPVVELARQIHAQRTRVSESENCLPSKSTATQGLATLVNIRNSGTESLDMTAGGVRWSLRSFDDPWDYDLVFAVNVRGSQVLGCSIEYTEGVVSESVASSFAESLTRNVETMMQAMM